MSDTSISTAPPPSNEALAVQAEQLARLRNHLADSQAKTGAVDQSALAEFAQIQRDFIEGKIQLEQMKMAGSCHEQPQEDESSAEGTRSGEVQPHASEARPLGPQEGARLLK